jgi:4-amino-4-deoxy-L-arabinose transferase-like glycosyltransferase
MPFSGMLTITMVCAAVVLGLTRNENSPVIPQTPWLARILFGFFLGLAVLAKGPAAIILSGGAVFFWALFTKRWRDAFRLFHPAALASFCLTALPWYILCARRSPDFFAIFVIEHNFKRYLTPEFQHLQPFWYYGPVLLIAFLPWTAPLLWSAVEGAVHLWRTRRPNESTLFLMCWAGFCLIFFSVSQSKLPGYILPAVPAIGLLLAGDITRRLQQKLPEIRWLCLSVSLTLVALGVAVGRLGEKIPFVTDIGPAATVTTFYASMVLAGVALGILAVLRRVRIALVLGAIVVPVFMTLGTAELWELDAGVSARPTAVEATRYLPAQLLKGATTYKLQRGLKFALNFYFRRELSEWSPPGGQRSIIFTSPGGSQELKQMGIECLPYLAHPAVEICAHSIRLTGLARTFPRREQLH